MDINKKSRAELKAYFVKNSIPTESNFSDFIEAIVSQKDDGLTKSMGSPLCVEAASTGEKPAIQLYESFPTAQTPNWVISLLPGVTAGPKTTGRGLGIGNGAGAAKARLFFEEATGNLAIGTVDPAGYALNIAGTLNVTGALTASSSVTIATGQALNANGPLNANAGLTIAAGQPFNANSTLNANAGLVVAAGQTFNANSTLNANAGLIVAAGQPFNANSTLNANAGLVVAAGQTFNANSMINANAGLTVAAGQTFNANSQLNANAGATVAGGRLNANAGLTVPTGQTLIANGPLTATAGATVSGGPLTTTILTFPAPPSDPAPVITARAVPVGQGNLAESSELILWHGNDGNNGAGPDYITLRAPGIRLQTYADATVSGIDNNAGSNTRLYIDPDGKTTLYGPLTIGAVGATQSLTVNGPTVFNGVMTGIPNDYAKAQYTLSGGGSITWGGTGGRLKWTTRFIVISAERSTTFSDGYMDIGPSSNAPAVVQDWDNAPRSSTADGVVLNNWEALYAVHPPGGAYTSATLRIAVFTQGFKTPSNWILVAVVNGDANTVKLGTGDTLAANSTVFKGALVPSGGIIMWGKAIIPDGWVLCDGNNGTPDLRDRFIIGAGATYAIGATGGESMHTLTINEMPAHAHQALGGGIDDLNFTGGNLFNGERIPFTRSDAPIANVEQTRNAGGGAAHENKPPYYALSYIMKL